MGPEATAEFYRLIIKIFQQKYGAVYDDDYPEIIIYNLPIPDVVENPNYGEKVKLMLCRGIQFLEKAGVDFIAIPCNTINYYLPEMRSSVSTPVLSILEETAKEIKTLGLRKVALLATEMTLSTRIYDQKLECIDLLKPSLKQQKITTDIVLQILSGKKTKKDRNSLKGIIASLQARGAEKVILGCTELPLLIGRDKNTLNTLKVLAKLVVQESTGGKKNEI